MYALYGIFDGDLRLLCDNRVNINRCSSIMSLNSDRLIWWASTNVYRIIHENVLGRIDILHQYLVLDWSWNYIWVMSLLICGYISRWLFRVKYNVIFLLLGWWVRWFHTIESRRHLWIQMPFFRYHPLNIAVINILFSLLGTAIWRINNSTQLLEIRHILSVWKNAHFLPLNIDFILRFLILNLVRLFIKVFQGGVSDLFLHTLVR